jgi:tetratricopeptide (TPR) repeat protein
VTADHGESLGEHGETTHGLFAYNATLAVPLIITGAGTGRVGVPVAHTDIMPTILDIVVAGGAPPRRNLDGQSLLGDLAADRPIYFESLDAYLTRGWAPLRGVIQGAVKYVDLPQDELYELDVDPGEEHNRVAQDPRAAAMRAVFRTLSSAPELPGIAAPVDADAASRLRSLGYVGRAAPLNAHPSAADDPKRLVALNERFNSALTAFDERRADVALSEFVAILRERPDFLSARTSAATILLNNGKGNDAVRLLEEAPSSQHASAEWSIRLGAVLREVGRMREAATVLEAARNAGADDAELTQNLATVYAALGRTSEARALFESVAAAEHAPATAWYNLGLVELQSGRKQEAARAFRRAVERDPSYGDAWNGLGASLVERDAAAAIEAWRNAEKTVAARLRSAVQRRHADRRPSPGERSGSLSAAVRRGGATASIRTGHRSRRAAIEGDREPFEMTASPGRLACIALSLLIAGCNRIPVPEEIDQRRRPWIQPAAGHDRYAAGGSRRQLRQLARPDADPRRPGARRRSLCRRARARPADAAVARDDFHRPLPARNRRARQRRSAARRFDSDAGNGAEIVRISDRRVRRRVRPRRTLRPESRLRRLRRPDDGQQRKRSKSCSEPPSRCSPPPTDWILSGRSLCSWHGLVAR